MAKGLKPPIKILDIVFARNKKIWHPIFLRNKKAFLKIVKNKKFQFTLASEKPEIFGNQIKNNDLVLIIGGDELLCLKRLEKLRNFKNLIKGKVVAGSSAGAYVLSRYYYSADRNEVGKGLGILPIKTLAHYNKGKSRAALERLKNIGESLRICKIPETHYVVIKSNI
ncbi:MAG: Type 1 glutamine amidotransferase-like domain-containing protein [Patescibacteria group bacterium]